MGIIKQKNPPFGGGYFKKSNRKFYLCVFSLLVVNFLRPLALRAANTLRPLAEAMRNLKPCLLILLRRDGWKVLFIVYSV